MTKHVREVEKRRRLTLQLPMALHTHHFDREQRAEIVALLSRLLLEVANAQSQGRARNERP